MTRKEFLQTIGLASAAATLPQAAKSAWECETPGFTVDDRVFEWFQLPISAADPLGESGLHTFFGGHLVCKYDLRFHPWLKRIRARLVQWPAGEMPTALRPLLDPAKHDVLCLYWPSVGEWHGVGGVKGWKIRFCSAKGGVDCGRMARMVCWSPGKDDKCADAREAECFVPTLPWEVPA